MTTLTRPSDSDVLGVTKGAALNLISQAAFDTGLSYGLSVVPLFILMGNLITEAGFSAQLYRASNAAPGTSGTAVTT